jgi:hypothetical protein
MRKHKADTDLTLVDRVPRSALVSEPVSFTCGGLCSAEADAPVYGMRAASETPLSALIC